MSKYRITQILFIIALSLLTVAYILQRISVIPLFAVSAVYLAILVTGSFVISINFYLTCHNHGPSNEKSIALSFDDGPHNTNTPRILTVLKKHNVKAAFFCVGSYIQGNEHIIKQIEQDGHIIGNHSFSHSTFFDFFSSRRMEQELSGTILKIESNTGKRAGFFRPPYGVTNPALAKTVKRLGLTTIGWNIRSLDTLHKNNKKIVNRTIKQLDNGAIILLHDTTKDIDILTDLLLNEIKKRNFTIKRLDLLIKKDAYV